jgi:hypothetical protein
VSSNEGIILLRKSGLGEKIILTWTLRKYFLNAHFIHLAQDKAGPFEHDVKLCVR